MCSYSNNTRGTPDLHSAKPAEKYYKQQEQAKTTTTFYFIIL